MFQKSILKCAIASCLGVSTLGGFAQTQNADLPAKGKLSKIVTLELPHLGKASTVYTSRGLESWELNGFSRLSNNSGITSGAYKSNCNLSAQSQSINLPALSGTEALYMFIEDSFSLEYEYDNGKILVSADNGKTWEVVSTVSGETDTRTDAINLSKYAGSSIIVKALLNSDGSFESTGWNINSISITKGDPFAPSMLKADAKEIKVTGVQTQNFPEYVYVDFEYRVNGVLNNSLTLNDLDLNAYVTGMPPIDDRGACPLRLYTPTNNSLKKLVDIVFLFDNSGSMTSKQQAVKDNIKDFVSAVAGNNDVAWGMVRFGQVADEPKPERLELLPGSLGSATDNLTREWAYYQGEIQARNVSKGSIERGYEALKLALNTKFRPGSQKIFILITDENTTDPQNMGPTTMDQTIKLLQASGAVVHSWIPALAEYDNTYANISKKTGGKRFDISKDILSLVADVSGNINSTYTLRYCPASTAYSATTEHNARVFLKSDKAVFSTGKYIVTSDVPYLVRDDNTISQEKKAFPEGATGKKACFDVKDKTTPYPTSGILYIKGTNSSTYTPVTMTEVSQKKWCGDIPSSLIIKPNYKYYAEVKYADNSTIKSPTTMQDFFAYTQAVLPNSPPEIIRILPASDSFYVDKTCITHTIKFSVSDNTNGYNDVRLYYREIKSGGAYNMHQAYQWPGIGALPTLGEYTFPVTLTGFGIEYYIVAIDDYNTIALLGDDKRPLEIMTPTNKVSTSTSTMNVRFDTNNKIACTMLQNGDIIKAYFLNECGEMMLAGQTTVNTAVPGSMTLSVSGNTNGANGKNGYNIGEILNLTITRAGHEYSINDPVIAYSTTPPALVSGKNWAPKINKVLRYGNVVVAPNDNTPTAAKGTLFESSVPVTHTFSLASSGCANSEIQWADVSNFWDFSVSADPVAKTVSVTYQASSTNASSTVTIYTVDGDYSFTVLGNIVTCNQTLRYSAGTIDILNGDATPTTAEGTDFGTVTAATTRTFNLSGTTCSPNLAITSVSSSSPDNFAVTFTGLSVSVQYKAVADASATITLVTNNGNFTYVVRGQKVTCKPELRFGSVVIDNGDSSPSASEGTDFGVSSTAVTRTYAMLGSTGTTSCTPVITSATSNDPSFTVTYSGTNITVKYLADITAAGTITVNTNDGPYTFDVAGKLAPACVVINSFPNPVSINGGQAKILLNITAGNTVPVTARIINSSGNLVKIYPTRSISAYYPYWEDNTGTLSAGSYYLVFTIDNNSSCTGGSVPFTVK